MLQRTRRIEIDARSSSMRQSTISLLCSACFLVAGCSSGTNNAPSRSPSGAVTNDPQKIVSDPGNIRVLHGEFEIREAKPNETSIANATNGGACLLAKIPVEGKSCTTQSECD